jgi:hypothetical protein
MLAAFANRHNVFNLQISSRTAVSAGVIELPPPSQEVGGGQVMGGATTLRHLARFGLGAVVKAVAGISHLSPTYVLTFAVTLVLLVFAPMLSPVFILLLYYKFSDR